MLLSVKGMIEKAEYERRWEKKPCMSGKKLNRRGTSENYYFPHQKPNRSATAEVKEPHAV